MDLEFLKRVGISAAYKSAEVLHSRLGKISSVNKKGTIDLVTEADTESERIIIQTIREKFPDHSILAEESGLNTKNPDCTWIIDPLDGTTNFTHQLSLFSVSIAFMAEGDVKVGVVLNPESGELFSAVKGKGAMLNGHEIKVTQTGKVGESLLVTGFPYNLREIIGPLISRFTQCLAAARGVRRLGSAALDLCFLACGRFDGFWEQNLKPWDTAAGMLIAKEAGACITDFSNSPFTIDKSEILATNGNIHTEMLSLLKLEMNYEAGIK